MTATDWNHLGILATQYVPWLAPVLAALWAWATHVAPFLSDKRLQSIASQAVAAAEQWVVPLLLPNGNVDKSPLYNYADTILTTADKRLTSEQRRRYIESAVADLHALLGTFTPATPPTPAQAAQTTQVQDDLAQLQRVVSDLAGVVSSVAATKPAPTTKLTRTERGTFTSGAAPVVVSRGATVDPSMAAPPEQAAPTGA